MIQDYQNLKKYCSIDYRINKRKFKVGDLYDSQLDIAKRILEHKVKLTEEEKQQIEAINYIIQYRSKCALEGLEKEMYSRRIDRANLIANNVQLWGDKIGTNIKKLSDKPFYESRKSIKIVK